MTAIATDKGNPPRSRSVDVEIEITGTTNQPPAWKTVSTCLVWLNIEIGLLYCNASFVKQSQSNCFFQAYPTRKVDENVTVDTVPISVEATSPQGDRIIYDIDEQSNQVTCCHCFSTFCL